MNSNGNRLNPHPFDKEDYKLLEKTWEKEPLDVIRAILFDLEDIFGRLASLNSWVVRHQHVPSGQGVVPPIRGERDHDAAQDIIRCEHSVQRSIVQFAMRLKGFKKLCEQYSTSSEESPKTDQTA